MNRIFTLKEYLYKPVRLYKEIKWFLQRGNRGYSDSDLWNFDFYLAELLTKVLPDMGEGLGHPVCDEICGKDISWDYDHKECSEKYKKLLADMAEGFQIYIDKEECESEEECCYGIKWWESGGCSIHSKNKYDKSWEDLKRMFPGLWT